MKTETHHFAEYVSPGHPDRLADAIAEGIVDHGMAIDSRALVGVEVAVHPNKVFIDGRVPCMKHGGHRLDESTHPVLCYLIRTNEQRSGYQI